MMIYFWLWLLIWFGGSPSFGCYLIALVLVVLIHGCKFASRSSLVFACAVVLDCMIAWLSKIWQDYSFSSMFLWFIVCLNPGEDSSFFLGFVFRFLGWIDLTWTSRTVCWWRKRRLMDESWLFFEALLMACVCSQFWSVLCELLVLYLFVPMNWFVSMEFGKRFSMCRIQREDFLTIP